MFKGDLTNDKKIMRITPKQRKSSKFIDVSTIKLPVVHRLKAPKSQLSVNGSDESTYSRKQHHPKSAFGNLRPNSDGRSSSDKSVRSNVSHRSNISKCSARSKFQRRKQM